MPDRRRRPLLRDPYIERSGRSIRPFSSPQVDVMICILPRIFAVDAVQFLEDEGVKIIDAHISRPGIYRAYASRMRSTSVYTLYGKYDLSYEERNVICRNYRYGRTD